MEYLAGVVVMVLALAAVVVPLLSPGRAELTWEPEVEDDAGSLHAQRQAIYRQIAELQLDRRLGKLDEADFRELKDALLSRAASLLEDAGRRRLAMEQLAERTIAEARAAAPEAYVIAEPTRSEA